MPIAPFSDPQLPGWQISDQVIYRRWEVKSPQMTMGRLVFPFIVLLIKLFCCDWLDSLFRGRTVTNVVILYEYISMFQVNAAYHLEHSPWLCRCTRPCQAGCVRARILPHVQAHVLRYQTYHNSFLSIHPASLLRSFQHMNSTYNRWR